jgi:Double zinc ribbon
MPLIQCPDCSQEVSDRAVSCPKCGFPIQEVKPVDKTPQTVNCLECKTGYDFYSEVCPKCGLFNSQKHRYASNDSRAMLWESEDATHLHVACPICGKAARTVVRGVIAIFQIQLFQLDQSFSLKRVS